VVSVEDGEAPSWQVSRAISESASAEGALDFNLSKVQLRLKDIVREFAERDIRPHVMEWDELSQFPLETIKAAGDLGLMGIFFPVEYGGAGAGCIEYATAIEELARAGLAPAVDQRVFTVHDTVVTRAMADRGPCPDQFIRLQRHRVLSSC
jgi:hypothetical protein